MRAEILILGQGLAGTMLAWELDRAGIPFAIVDRGHAKAATSAAAGIVNPVTGRRLVKSWRIETLLPAARATYRELEIALGLPLWRELRVRRLFADQRERDTAREKLRRGELAPYVDAGNAEAAGTDATKGETDSDGLWIRAAARVDLAVLLAAARARWQAAGKLRPEDIGDLHLENETGRHDCIIDCTGQGAAESGRFDFVPWQFSKGEVLEIAVEGLAQDVVLNCRHWLVPTGPATALIGATNEPGVRDALPTPAARAALETSARELLGAARPFRAISHRAGVRVYVPDKHPVAGWHPSHPRLGIINGLGAKGALWAPQLARAWVKHLAEGAAFDPEIDVRRVAPK